MAEQLAAAEAAAQANAVRPGDEALSCEALQAEMVAIVQSPEMQAFVQTAGPQAQAQLAQLNAAQAEQEAAASSRPRLGGQIARGLAVGVVPGLQQANAQAQQAASIAQAAEAQAQAEQNQRAALALGSQAATLAGPAMRGQRVIELAQARDCAFLKEGGMPPGALPPGAVPPGGLPPGFAPPGAPPPGAAPPR
jgi:hypothetical protein